MSTDADAHKVGLIPVTLMVSGNIMGSGVFLLPANLASTGGIAIYGWLVTIIGALALSMVYAKMSSLDSSPGGSYAYARRCFGPFLGYQTNVLYWLACWIGNIAMVVIGVGYLSYFFPILKDPLSQRYWHWCQLSGLPSSAGSGSAVKPIWRPGTSAV